MCGYVAGFKQRQAAAAERSRELASRARESVHRAVERLKAIPEVRRIILYGSLAKGTLHQGSDIDFAVEGLPATSHFQVWAEIERDAGCTIDLQRLEELGDGFRQVILRYGEVLYTRP